MQEGMLNGEGALVQGIVDDYDAGALMTSLQIRSGQRVISVVIPTSEALRAGVEPGAEIYCLIRGRDISVFRDPREFFGAQQTEQTNRLRFVVPSQDV